ncbi:MAG: RluA family pseudouridine synthase [Burkholderiaceae bacterium]
MTDATGSAVDLPAPIALPAVAGERLDRLLAARLEPDAISRSRIQRWIAIGAVRVDGALALRSRRLKGFETIEVWPQPLESEQAFRPEPVALEVLHADADVVVIAKPAGLVTHPAPGNWQGTLMNGLLHRFAQTRDLPRAGIVHRLDRDTSGLLACALSERGFIALTRQLADRSMQRRYLAVVPTPPQSVGSICAAIARDPRDRLRMAAVPATHFGAKSARTDYRVVDEHHGIALVHCRLHSGRTHQIRVHFAAIGCPLIGDAVYGGRTDDEAIARQALHAWRLRFRHPDGSGLRAFVAPLPDDLRRLLDRLSLAPPESGAADPYVETDAAADADHEGEPGPHADHGGDPGPHADHEDGR